MSQMLQVVALGFGFVAWVFSLSPATDSTGRAKALCKSKRCGKFNINNCSKETTARIHVLFQSSTRAHLLIGILRCVLGRLLPWRAWKTSMRSWRLWKRWRRKRQMQLGLMPAGLQSAPCEHQVYLRCQFQRPASRVVHVEALLGSALQRDCSHYVWVHTRFIQLPPLFSYKMTQKMLLCCSSYNPHRILRPWSKLQQTVHNISSHTLDLSCSC